MQRTHVETPRCGLRPTDATAEFYNALHKYLLAKGRSYKEIGLTPRLPQRDPRLYYVMRGTGQSAGVVPTHIDDILGCGESGFMGRVRVRLTERFGTKEIREIPGMIEISQSRNFATEVTRKVFTDDLQFVPTSGELCNQGLCALIMQIRRASLGGHGPTS